jgi:hypothetical protein
MKSFHVLIIGVRTPFCGGQGMGYNTLTVSSQRTRFLVVQIHRLSSNHPFPHTRNEPLHFSPMSDKSHMRRCPQPLPSKVNGLLADNAIIASLNLPIIPMSGLSRPAPRFPRR